MSYHGTQLFKWFKMAESFKLNAYNFFINWCF